MPHHLAFQSDQQRRIARGGLDLQVVGLVPDERGRRGTRHDPAAQVVAVVGRGRQPRRVLRDSEVVVDVGIAVSGLDDSGFVLVAHGSAREPAHRPRRPADLHRGQAVGGVVLHRLRVAALMPLGRQIGVVVVSERRRLSGLLLSDQAIGVVVEPSGRVAVRDPFHAVAHGVVRIHHRVDALARRVVLDLSRDPANGVVPVFPLRAQTEQQGCAPRIRVVLLRVPLACGRDHRLQPVHRVVIVRERSRSNERHRRPVPHRVVLAPLLDPALRRADQPSRGVVSVGGRARIVHHRGSSAQGVVAQRGAQVVAEPLACEPPRRVVGVRHASAAGVGLAGQPPRRVVVVVAGVLVQLVLHPPQLPRPPVVHAQHAALGVGEVAQPADLVVVVRRPVAQRVHARKGRVLVRVVDGARDLAVGVGDGGAVARQVVLELRQPVHGVHQADHLARRVVDRRAAEAHRRDHGGLAAQSVVDELRLVAQGVRAGDHVPRVVAVDRGVAPRVRDRAQTVGRVVLVARDVAQRVHVPELAVHEGLVDDQAGVVQGVGDRRQAPLDVVGVLGDVAQGVGLGEPVAEAPVGVAGALVEGVDDRREQAGVVHVLGGVPVGVHAGDQMVGGVVGHRPRSGSHGQRAGDHPAQFVVRVPPHAAVGGGHGGHVAVGVVLVRGAQSAGIDLGEHRAVGVVDRAGDASERVGA